MPILGLVSFDKPLWEMPQINLSQSSFGSCSKLMASSRSARLSTPVGITGSFSTSCIQSSLASTADLTTWLPLLAVVVVVVVALVVLVVLVAVFVLVVVVMVLVTSGGGGGGGSGFDLGGDGIPAIVIQT